MNLTHKQKLSLAITKRGEEMKAVNLFGEFGVMNVDNIPKSSITLSIEQSKRMYHLVCEINAYLGCDFMDSASHFKKCVESNNIVGSKRWLFRCLQTLSQYYLWAGALKDSHGLYHFDNFDESLLSFGRESEKLLAHNQDFDARSSFIETGKKWISDAREAKNNHMIEDQQGLIT